MLILHLLCLFVNQINDRIRFVQDLAKLFVIIDKKHLCLNFERILFVFEVNENMQPSQEEVKDN